MGERERDRQGKSSKERETEIKSLREGERDLDY
jgi:hypothetical protein